MITSRQIRRMQKLLLLMAGGLAIYYGAVYRRLEERSDALNLPLAQAWKKLSAATVTDAEDEKIDLPKIEKHFQQAQSALNKLTQAEKKMATRLALGPATRARIHEPFQLIDFQSEEQYRMEELGHLAAQNHVGLHSSVWAGFPEYTADKSQPGFLWAQLFFLDHLLSTAVRCKVSLIQSIDLPLISGHQLSSTNNPFLYEIPLRIEVVGSMESISQLLSRLPLREDGNTSNSSGARNGKPPLFIHRFILKKNSPENRDEVLLDLRTCGFVYPD